jgi:hypothetical protein
MAIRIALLEEGTRVRVRRSNLPLDPAVVGRSGTVLEASPYHVHRIGVVLDGETLPRQFRRTELEVVAVPALPRERERAKGRRALP